MAARNVLFQLIWKAVMLQQDALIINKLGLHARASAKLTQPLRNFPVKCGCPAWGRRVNAKSIMGVMMLAAAKGRLSTSRPTARRNRKRWMRCWLYQQFLWRRRVNFTLARLPSPAASPSAMPTWFRTPFTGSGALCAAQRYAGWRKSRA